MDIYVKDILYKTSLNYIYEKSTCEQCCLFKTQEQKMKDQFIHKCHSEIHASSKRNVYRILKDHKS